MIEKVGNNNFPSRIVSAQNFNDLIKLPIISNGLNIFEEVKKFLAKFSKDGFIDGENAAKLTKIQTGENAGGWNPALYAAKNDQGYETEKVAKVVADLLDKAKKKWDCTRYSCGVSNVKDGVFYVYEAVDYDEKIEQKECFVDVDGKSYRLFTLPPSTVTTPPSYSDRY
ncbi:MAG: hypothetical protein V4691_02030 [Pseudomonadota bacterium]